MRLWRNPVREALQHATTIPDELKGSREVGRMTYRLDAANRAWAEATDLGPNVSDALHELHRRQAAAQIGTGAMLVRETMADGEIDTRERRFLDFLVDRHHVLNPLAEPERDIVHALLSAPTPAQQRWYARMVETTAVTLDDAKRLAVLMHAPGPLSRTESVFLHRALVGIGAPLASKLDAEAQAFLSVLRFGPEHVTQSQDVPVQDAQRDALDLLRARKQALKSGALELYDMPVFTDASGFRYPGGKG